MSLISNYHHIGNTGKGILDLVLNGNRRNILSSSRNNQLFDSSSEIETICLELSKIPRVKISFFVKNFACLFRVVQVTHHYISSLHTYFTIFISLFFLPDDCLAALLCPSNFKKIIIFFWIKIWNLCSTMRPCCLSQAIAIKENNIH